MSTFVKINNNGQNTIYCLENMGKEIIVLGRNADCDIAINSPVISGSHGCFFLQDGCWNYQDLNSTNGSYINGNRVFSCRINNSDIMSFIAQGSNTNSVYAQIVFSGQAGFGAVPGLVTPGQSDPNAFQGETSDDDKKSKKKKGLIIAGLAAMTALIIGTIVFFAVRSSSNKKVLSVADKDINRAAEKEVKLMLDMSAGKYSKVEKYAESIPEELFDSVVSCIADAEGNATSEYITFESVKDVLKEEVRKSSYYDGWGSREEIDSDNSDIYYSRDYSVEQFIDAEDYYSDNSTVNEALLRKIDKEFETRIAVVTANMHYKYYNGRRDYEYDYEDEITVVLIKYKGNWTPITLLISAITYVDKSRKYDDVTAAGTVLVGVQTAMADEDCYSEIWGVSNRSNGAVQILSVKAGSRDDCVIAYAAGPNLEMEIKSTLASGCPIKYTKKNAKYYNVFIDGDCLSVYISPEINGSDWQIQPNTDQEYR